MFPVEIRISDESRLSQQMVSMRTWLDKQRFEPSMFRHTATGEGLVLRVEFKVEAEAAAFANAFGGHVLPISAGEAVIL